MFSIKKMLVDLYDSRTAQSCSASIGDIMNLRRNVEHNQFLATTRYLDIKDYVEYNKQTFVWQNTVSRAAYGNKHREEDGNMAFSKLITSYQSKGYDPNSLFIVDKDMRLLDGNHRMGMNLYTDQHKINVNWPISSTRTLRTERLFGMSIPRRTRMRSGRLFSACWKIRC